MLDQEKVKKQQSYLGEALENVLNEYPEEQQKEAREMVANFVFGYVGASFGLKVESVKRKCSLGYCATKEIKYGGGSGLRFQKDRCPECGDSF